MIRKLSLSNFKSWSSIENKKFEKLTGLFGTNSSGKTSLIQFLLLLKQTIASSDRTQVLNFGTDKDPVALGSYRDVIHNHLQEQELSFELSFDLNESIDIKDTEEKSKVLFSANKLNFGCNIFEAKSKRLCLNSLFYSFSDNKFTMKKNKEKNTYTITSQPTSDKKQFKFTRTRGRIWELPAPIKFYGFPDQVRTYYQNAGFLFDLQLELEKQFSNIYYLGPLREYPKRQYNWVGMQPSDMGQRGERVIEALLASRLNNLKISRGHGRKSYSLEQYVAYWLQKLGLIDSFRIEEVGNGSNIYNVLVKKNKNSSEVLITDVGFGVSQILPVITLCYYVPEGSTLLIEQPEIHLHPSVQAGLADVFIDAIQKKNIQIVLESHSEHLLRRLQRRVAEEKVNNDFVKLYFCSNDTTQSKLTNLEMDLFGNIINWPDNFFGDEIGEMTAMNEAIIERKMKK
ncbi:MAG: DNA replication and repair protein RecF [bacterium ADurb.Bin243]|nr:DUF3696 domain-containing protein [Bacteroidales bacterium]OQA81070.1 MAG: DNA replication and repair protein RecF [bacterium ADurb.Bin243]